MSNSDELIKELILINNMSFEKEDKGDKNSKDLIKNDELNKTLSKNEKNSSTNE